MSCVMRKPTFCICENKGTYQLCSNCTADQCLCFHNMDSTIPLLSKSKISSRSPFSVLVQFGLCQAVRKRIVCFLMTWLNYSSLSSLLDWTTGWRVVVVCLNVSIILRKPAFYMCEQQLCRPACTFILSDQQCCSHPAEYNTSCLKVHI